jgi:hypothetical protein
MYPNKIVQVDHHRLTNNGLAWWLTVSWSNDLRIPPDFGHGCLKPRIQASNLDFVCQVSWLVIG